MRNYFFGLVAIVIAIGTFAFTQVEKNAQVDMYVFRYDDAASGGYAESDVEDISNANWKFDGINAALCSNTDQKACRVAVVAAYVDNTTTPTALQGVTIDATQSGTTAHVNTISGSGNQKSNQVD
jgi:hypothetical protein